jgi:hypothetical protein
MTTTHTALRNKWMKDWYDTGVRESEPKWMIEDDYPMPWKKLRIKLDALVFTYEAAQLELTTHTVWERWENVQICAEILVHVQKQIVKTNQQLDKIEATGFAFQLI